MEKILQAYNGYVSAKTDARRTRSTIIGGLKTMSVPQLERLEKTAKKAGLKSMQQWIELEKKRRR